MKNPAMGQGSGLKDLGGPFHLYGFMIQLICITDACLLFFYFTFGAKDAKSKLKLQACSGAFTIERLPHGNAISGGFLVL